MSQSCLIEKFSRYLDLREHEIELLHDIEKDPKQFSKDAVVVENSKPSKLFYVVQEGWLQHIKYFSDGEKSIVDIKMPGDIIGLHQIYTDVSLVEVRFLTEGVLCPFDRGQLDRIFHESSPLATLFYALIARENAFLIERVAGLGKIDSAQKVANLILLILLRLEESSEQSADGEYKWPIDQSLVGDLLGLSSVHVNRSLAVLRDNGFIEYRRGALKVLNRSGLEQFCDFSVDLKNAKKIYN